MTERAPIRIIRVVNARRIIWLLPGLVGLTSAAAFDATGRQFPQAFVDVGIGCGYFVPGAAAYLLRSENRAARWLLAMVSAIALAKAAGDGASLAVQPDPWWLTVALNAVGWAIFAAAVGLFTTFPDGIARRPYERYAPVVAAAVFGPLQLAQLLGSAQIRLEQFGWRPIVARSPIRVPGLAPVGEVADAIFQLSALLLLPAVVLLVLRYRRADPEQKRRIRWPFLGVVVSILTLIPQFLPTSAPPLPFWMLAALYVGSNVVLPSSLAIGIADPRRLDVDVVIRRSAVFGVLWALIAAAYVGFAAALGIAAGQRVPLGMAVIIAIAATLLIQPVRVALERMADRVVYGHRLSGYELLTTLGARLELASATEDLAREVADAVRIGMGAAWVTLLLNRPEPVVVSEVGEQGHDDAPALAAPLVHGDVAIGEIQCGRRVEGDYTSSDSQLLATLGRQAALAIRNAQLTSELSDRLEELAASRMRLVQAEEAGRRRLERDLHDGVQQELVALLARLGLARAQIPRDSERAERTVREAQEDARRALENLQDLARGIHPTLLTDRGLVEAVEERASRLTLPVDVTVYGLTRETRFLPDLEGAAYFVVSEALTNVVKHAGASRACVRFTTEADRLVIRVQDDGRGLDATRADGSGLRGLRDRVEALGGSLRVEAAPSSGTALTAELPLERESLHA